MDRTVNVRFFSVENLEAGGVSFSDCLREVFRRPLADRESEIEDEVVVRLERLSDAQGHLVGQFVRIQSENLPPRAIRGARIARLGVPSIGHTAAFRYDARRSILALQLGHNGITAPRLSLYLQDLLNIEGFGILPVITQDAWEKLDGSRVRKLLIRIAQPEHLQAVAQEHQSVKAGFEAMKRAGQTTYVEVAMGMGHAEADISHARARSIFQWLVRERQNNDAKISKLAAVVRDDESSELQLLTFFDAHMGEKTKLGLPRDDPDRAYQMIDQFIRRAFTTRRAEINAQF